MFSTKRGLSVGGMLLFFFCTEREVSDSLLCLRMNKTPDLGSAAINGVKFLHVHTCMLYVYEW